MDLVTASVSQGYGRNSELTKQLCAGAGHAPCAYIVIIV